MSDSKSINAHGTLDQILLRLQPPPKPSRRARKNPALFQKQFQKMADWAHLKGYIDRSLNRRDWGLSESMFGRHYGLGRQAYEDSCPGGPAEGQETLNLPQAGSTPVQGPFLPQPRRVLGQLSVGKDVHFSEAYSHRFERGYLHQTSEDPPKEQK